MRAQKETFGKRRLPIDGRIFKDCVFDGTTLLYFGGEIPQMENCEMRGVRFEFGGPAKNTVQLIRWLQSQNMIAQF